MDNQYPQCPSCGSYDSYKRGGARRSCKDCGKYYTPGTKSQGKIGRPLIGDRPMTPAEKVKRHRAKKSTGKRTSIAAKKEEFFSYDQD